MLNKERIKTWKPRAKRAGLLLTDLAKLAGINLTQLSKIINGQSDTRAMAVVDTIEEAIREREERLDLPPYEGDTE